MDFKAITRTFNKVSLVFNEKKPFIATGASIILGAAALGYGIKQAMAIPGIISEYEENLRLLKEKVETEKIEDPDYSDKMTKAIRVDAGLKIVKKLAIPVGMEIASALLNAYSTGEMWNRYKTATIMYGGAMATLKAFEKNVLDDVGEVKFKELRYGIKSADKTWSSVNEETGETVEHHEETEILSDENKLPNVYAKWFEERGDGYCADWSKDPKANRLFLQQKEKMLTDMLVAKGYLWLNEAYEELGLPLTEIGQRVGWIYDARNPIGDNYVDFGIFTEGTGVKNRGFVDRENNRYLLNFNVDGDLFGLPLLRKYGVEQS